MSKNNKASSKGEEKSNKIIKNTDAQNRKKKKKQLEKVKKSVETLAGVAKLEAKNKGGKESKTKMKIFEDAPDFKSGEESVEETEVESGEESVEPVKKSEFKSEDDANTEECAEGVGHTVVVSNLPAKTSRSQLLTLFAPYGKIMSILFITDGGIVFSKIVPIESTSAYVVLDSVEAAEKALDLKGTHLNGQQLCVEKPKETQKLGQENKFLMSNSKNTIFVTNLSSNNEDIIKNFFSSYGEIAYVNILKTQFEGKYRAFVCFKDDGTAKLALKSNGSMLEEQPIKVVPFSEKLSKKSKLKHLDKQDFKNLNTEEFKNQMLQLVEKFIKPTQGKKPRSKKNSEFRGVKSGGIKKVDKLLEGVMSKFNM